MDNTSDIGRFKAFWDKTQEINQRIIERNQRWETINKAGVGAVEDYLRADFDADCPIGLDTKPWPSKHIRIDSMLNSPNFKKSRYHEQFKSLVRWGGWVQHDLDNVVHLNPLYFSPLAKKIFSVIRASRGKKPIAMTYILPHEFIHTRQHYIDHSGWNRGFGGNDFKHDGIHELPKLKRVWRQTVRRYHDFKPSVAPKFDFVSNYYARNVEIQARMHEILAYGYVEWQKLPTSKIELWAVLHNLGLKTPQSISEELRGTEDGQKALNDFKVSAIIKHAVLGTVSTFNKIHNYAGELSVQEDLWKSKYPLLYGELIEFYGDKLGRERMGAGINPRPAIEVFYEIKEKGVTAEKAREMAARVPASLAVSFINNTIYRFNEGSASFDNAMQVAKAFLAREDVKSVLFAGNQTFKQGSLEGDRSPLEAAMNCNHHAMVRLLIDAGADPFQGYAFHDKQGKFRFSRSPIQMIENVTFLEKALSNPSSLHKKARSYYTKPENRSREEGNIKRMRETLAVLLDSSPDPQQKKKNYSRDGNYEEISLEELLSRIGISKSKPIENPAFDLVVA